MKRKDLAKAIAKLAADNGYESTEDMLGAAVMDGECPGMCTSCGAVQDNVEPDAEGYTCDECDEPRVDSVLIITGVM